MSGTGYSFTELMNSVDRKYWVDPVTGLPGFDKGRRWRETFFLFAVMVAGKPAIRVAAQVNFFLVSLEGSDNETPFERIRRYVQEHGQAALRMKLVEARTGQYGRVMKVIQTVVLDPTFDLLQSPGPEVLSPIVGPKTARYFLLYSHPGARCAPIDTHLLWFLRERLCPIIDPELAQRIPVSTPSEGRLLRQMESILLNLADSQNFPIVKLDLAIWHVVRAWKLRQKLDTLIEGACQADIEPQVRFLVDGYFHGWLREESERSE